MQSLLRKINGLFSPGVPKPAPIPAEVEIDETIFNNYSFIIGSVFSYFNELSPELKWRFVSRTHQFRLQKKFHYIGLENNEDTAILVSASAVQITFGLTNYSMSYFKDIYILADAYHM